MDSVINVNLFPPLATPLCTLSSHDCHFWKRIRLLSVFGCNAQEVIFATHDDEVFGFGRNLFGSLGLGHSQENIRRPEFNATLSGKQLVSIFSGYEHYIGLTATGQCYAWGNNHFGQLGVSDIEATETPQLIQGFCGQRIVGISCGGIHTLVLTRDGQVYSFGTNKLGQLGDETKDCRWQPKKIALEERVTSVSCGKHHSLVLTSSGHVYSWGININGQLGHSSENIKSFVCGPKPILFSETTVISKVVCGPNHSLLLSSDGCVYSFGANNSGQIGNGSTDCQLTPYKICNEIKSMNHVTPLFNNKMHTSMAIKLVMKNKFKDIIANKANELSMAVTVDDKYYVWGLVNGQRQSTPILVTAYGPHSPYDLYASVAKTKVTYETVVVGCEVQNTSSCETLSSEPEDIGIIGTIKLNGSSPFSQSTENSSLASETSFCIPYPTQLMSDMVIKSFNDPNNSDLVFRCKDNAIYCHKTILKIRNKKFWRAVSTRIRDNNEIVLSENSFDSFHALLKYFYGIEPEINEKVVEELHIMAKAFDETKLLEDCSRYITELENSVSLSNICCLYQKAVNESLPDLEKSCVEFAANNLTKIIKSEDFQLMNDKFSKQLMLSIFE